MATANVSSLPREIVGASADTAQGFLLDSAGHLVLAGNAFPTLSGAPLSEFGLMLVCHLDTDNLLTCTLGGIPAAFFVCSDSTNLRLYRANETCGDKSQTFPIALQAAAYQGP